MDFKIKQYRNRKEELVEVYRQKGISHVSYYCAVAMFPIIAAMVFIYEETGDEEAKRKIEVLKEFYELTNIVEE